MSEKEKYIEALKKRALGYEYEETTTLIEETAHGTKKKIVRSKKHLPPDVETAKFLLKQLNTQTDDFKQLLDDFEKELKEVANGNYQEKVK